MDDENKKKGLFLLGVARVADKAVLAWHVAADTGSGSSGYTGAVLKEVSACAG